MGEHSADLGGRPGLEQRVAVAIIDAAAQVLATTGDSASMQDVAVAAGMARATVYRYFPTRQHLLDTLAAVAVETAHDRLRAARISEVPVREGLRRAVRALVDAGGPFLVLARERVQPDRKDLDRKVGTPLRALVKRGQAQGELRRDLPPSWLVDALVSLVSGVAGSPPRRGRDDTVAAVASLFLEGVRTPTRESRGDGEED